MVNWQSLGEQVGEEINKLANAMLDGMRSGRQNGPVGSYLCTVYDTAAELFCLVITHGNCADATCIKSATRQTDNPKAYETSVIEQLSIIQPTTVAKLPIVSAMNFIWVT